MSSNPTPTSLSVGTLDTIFESKNCSLAPVVQVLCTKAMSNGRLRAVINDGRTLFQHCIITEECTSAGGDDGKLLAAALDDKYAVVRLKDYSISSLPKKDNMPVLLVNQLEVIKLGKHHRSGYFDKAKPNTLLSLIRQRCRQEDRGQRELFRWSCFSAASTALHLKRR